MDCYIVRIYRRQHDQLIGTLQPVGCNQTRPFHSVEELWDLMQAICTELPRHSEQPGKPEA